MNPTRAYPGVSKVTRDFLLGLVLFGLVAAQTCQFDVGGLSAHAAELPWPPVFSAFDAPPPAELRGSAPVMHLPALVTMGLAFATAFAVNMWFARHVRRVYVSAERRGQRR